MEWDLLDHVRQYRMGVTRFCWSATQRKQADVTKREVKELLQSLHQVHGYMESVPPFGKQKYYRVTHRYFSDLDVQPDHGTERPLSEDEKLGAYAMLGFCFGDRHRARQKLTADDLREYFPELAESVDRPADRARLERYYLAGDRLGYLRIDKGGRGRWDRIVSYVDRDIGRHESQPGFSRLIADGYFEVTVVTATAQKARRLRQLIAERPIHQRVPVDCFVLPELLHFLAPPPMAGAHYIPQRGF
jgi:hypothetical protein